MLSLFIVFVSLLSSAYLFEDPPNVLVFVTDDWGWGDFVQIWTRNVRHLNRKHHLWMNLHSLIYVFLISIPHQPSVHPVALQR